MILKKQNLKIATILPYKENYTSDKASAALGLTLVTYMAWIIIIEIISAKTW